MEKVITAFFLLAMASSGFAQTSPTPNSLPAKAVEKYLLTWDYNSWFEKLTVLDPTTEQNSKALYYGFGLGLEKNWYQPVWGWGMSAAILGGSAVGGDKEGALAYFEARVPWTGVRMVPRVFYRWNPRIDLGLDVATFYKKVLWPGGATNISAKSGSDLITGLFLDMRVRFNQRIEMIQSFGMLYKDESLYWRLGLAYRL